LVRNKQSAAGSKGRGVVEVQGGEKKRERGKDNTVNLFSWRLRVKNFPARLVRLVPLCWGTDGGTRR